VLVLCSFPSFSIHSMSNVFVAAFLLLPSATSLRLSTLESEPVLCAGSGNPCDGNQCCAGYPFSNSLTFPCPNADEGFAGCQTTERYTYQEETVVQSEPVKCPGSCDWCSGEQCCPGFADSNNLTFPCPTASASYNMCQSTTRFTDSSACDAIPTSAIGDPHVTSVTGVKFDLWKTGWSTFVQIPKDVQPNFVPKIVITGNVLPYGVDVCAPAFLQDVKLTGSMMDGHEVLVRAGPLDGAAPFAVSFDGGDFQPINAARDFESFSAPAFSLNGMISDDEPGVWGPDAKLYMKIGALVVTVKQHTEGRLADSRSMLDLSVDGLDGVDSVSGWLGVDGSVMAGEAPAECLEAAFIADGEGPSTHKQGSASFQSPRVE